MAETLKEFFIKVNFDNSGFDKLQQKTKQFTENLKKLKVDEALAYLNAEKQKNAILRQQLEERYDLNKNTEQRITENFKHNIEERKNQLQSFVAIFKKIASYLPAVFSTAFIKNSVGDFVKKGMEADETSSLLGISPEAFQQISGAFNRFGVESSSMAGQLSAINKQIQQAEKGTGRLKIVLDKFGLSIKNANGEIMSADEFLLSMSDQLKNFDGKTRGAILAMMGFDNSIQSAFSDGGEALNGFLAKQKELMLITQKDTEMAKKFTFQIKDLRDNITRIKNVIARFFLPVLTKLAEITTKFINWIFKHKTAFIAILSIIALSLKGILASLTAIVIKVAILAAPFVAIVAVITGLVLLFEDIYYYFKGWDSVTGELVKKFPSLEIALKPLEPLVKMIGQAFEDIAEFFANPSFDNFTAIFENIERGIINTAQQWGDVFIDVLATSLNGYIDLFKFLDDLLTDIFTGLKNWIISGFTAIFAWFSNKIKSVVEAIKNLKIDDILQTFKNSFDKVFTEIKSIWNNIDWIETFNQIFKFEWWNDKLENLKAWFKDTFNAIGDFFIDIFNSVIDWFENKIKAITEPIKNLTKGITGKAVEIKNSVSEKVQNAKNFFGFRKEQAEPIKNINDKIQVSVEPIKSIGDKAEPIKNIKSLTNDKTKDFKNFFGFGTSQNVAPLPVVNSSNTYSTNNNFNQNIEVSVNGSVDRRNADYLAHSIGNQLRGTNFQNGSTGRF